MKPLFSILSSTMAKVEPAHKNEARLQETKLAFWSPKQSSVMENAKPHRARTLFWKLVKTCPKQFTESDSSSLIPNYDYCVTCPLTLSPLGPKTFDLVTKTMFRDRKNYGSSSSDAFLVYW